VTHVTFGQHVMPAQGNLVAPSDVSTFGLEEKIDNPLILECALPVLDETSRDPDRTRYKASPSNAQSRSLGGNNLVASPRRVYVLRNCG
jgi:hypothetical protein